MYNIRWIILIGADLTITLCSNGRLRVHRETPGEGLPRQNSPPDCFAFLSCALLALEISRSAERRRHIICNRRTFVCRRTSHFLRLWLYFCLTGWFLHIKYIGFRFMDGNAQLLFKGRALPKPTSKVRRFRPSIASICHKQHMVEFYRESKVNYEGNALRDGILLTSDLQSLRRHLLPWKAGELFSFLVFIVCWDV